MKKAFLVFIALLVIAISVKSQDNLTADQLQVQKTLSEIFTGIAESNFDKIKPNCTADIILLENGSIWNLDTLALKISERKSKDYKRVNTIDFIETEVKGDFAWTIYHNKADFSLNGQSMTIKWLESAVLLKEGKGWKVKTLHSTLVERIKK